MLKQCVFVFDLLTESHFIFAAFRCFWQKSPSYAEGMLESWND